MFEFDFCLVFFGVEDEFGFVEMWIVLFLDFYVGKIVVVFDW